MDIRCCITMEHLLRGLQTTVTAFPVQHSAAKTRI